jgi:GTPase
LAIRPQILALSKIDAVDDEEIAEIAAELSKVAKQPVFLISSATRTGLEPMLKEVWNELDRLEAIRIADKLALQKAAAAIG